MENPDRKYFTESILPCHTRMYGAAFAIIGSSDEAADAVQTAMLRIWEAVVAGKRPENPSAYCMSAIRNICLSRLEQQKRSLPISEGREPAVPGDQPEKSMEFSEVRQRLRELPPNERRAIELNAYAGCSSEQIATALHTTPANARQLLSRGRRKLRSLFS